MRRLLALLAALALVAAACGDGDEGTTDDDADPGGGPERPTCTNEDDGFRVSYPEGWATNDGEVLAACSLFDPDAADVVVEAGTEVPLSVAVSIDREDAAFADVAGPARGEQVLSRQEGEVDGRQAERIEVEAGPDAGLLPEGARQTRWVVSLSDATLVARTNDVGEPPHREAQEVLDEMVESIELVPVGGGTTTSPPGAGGTTTTTGSAGDGALDPVGAFEDGPVESAGFPSSDASVAYLTDVRLAGHDGFDRFVLELDGGEPPAHRIGYVDPPIRQDGSGRPVEVDGGAVLEVRLTPATGVDLTSAEPVETYPGPDSVEAPYVDVVTEAVAVSDFEAQLTWAIGVDERRPFAVAFFEDPLRLVVDVET